MEFVLIFITSPSQAKLGRTTRQQLLTLASLLKTKCQSKFFFVVSNRKKKMTAWPNCDDNKKLCLTFGF
jgi:hypothetical protein